MNGFKLIAASVTFAALAGCATSAPSQYYRPANSPDQYKISGEYNQLSYKLDIFIDGNSVLSGRMPLFSNDLELSGQFNNMPVESICFRKVSAFSENVQCTVLIENEMAATLTF